MSSERSTATPLESKTKGWNAEIETSVITSPEISSLFSIALSNQFLKEFPNAKNVNLLELGPGNGLLTVDIYHYLNYMEQLHHHPIVLMMHRFDFHGMYNPMDQVYYQAKFLNY